MFTCIQTFALSNTLYMVSSHKWLVINILYLLFFVGKTAFYSPAIVVVSPLLHLTCAFDTHKPPARQLVQFSLSALIETDSAQRRRLNRQKEEKRCSTCPMICELVCEIFWAIWCAFPPQKNMGKYFFPATYVAGTNREKAVAVRFAGAPSIAPHNYWFNSFFLLLMSARRRQ